MGCCLSVAGQKKRPPVNERARTRRLALDRLVDLAGIASDNRCRTPIWAFSTITARMAPGGSAYPFTTAAWTRHMTIPAAGTALAYLDFSAMGIWCRCRLIGVSADAAGLRRG
jgi:hypothetical protein